MQDNDTGYSVVSVPPFSPEQYARACVQAAAELAYYAAVDHCQPGRLTKKFLMAAQAGGYLVSNLSHSTVSGHAPIFAEVGAESAEAKLHQREPIKVAEADDRLCYLHRSQDTYEQHIRLAEFGGIRIS